MANTEAAPALLDPFSTVMESATIYLSALRDYGWDDQEHTIPASDQLDQDITDAISRTATNGQLVRLVRTLAFEVAIRSEHGGAE